jgi:hypothetical protein
MLANAIHFLAVSHQLTPARRLFKFEYSSTEVRRLHRSPSTSGLFRSGNVRRYTSQASEERQHEEEVQEGADCWQAPPARLRLWACQLCGLCQVPLPKGSRRSRGPPLGADHRCRSGRCLHHGSSGDGDRPPRFVWHRRRGVYEQPGLLVPAGVGPPLRGAPEGPFAHCPSPGQARSQTQHLTYSYFSCLHHYYYYYYYSSYYN